MVNFHRFPAHGAPSIAQTHNGAACITYHDPYMPRTLETIKTGLSRGHPLLARLHGGADYSNPKRQRDTRNQIDIEGHAV